MVKTALSVYLIFMPLLVGLYFVAAPIIHGDTDEFPIWGVINYFMAIAVVHRTGRQFHAQARHGEPWTRCGRRPVPPHKHRLLQRPLALPLVLLGSGSKHLFGGGGSDLSWAWIDPLFAIVVGAVGRQICQSTEDI